MQSGSLDVFARFRLAGHQTLISAWGLSQWAKCGSLFGGARVEFPGGSLAEMQLPPKDLLAFPTLADAFHGVGVFRYESRNSLGWVLSVGSHHASVGAVRTALDSAGWNTKEEDPSLITRQLLAMTVGFCSLPCPPHGSPRTAPPFTRDLDFGCRSVPAAETHELSTHVANHEPPR